MRLGAHVSVAGSLAAGAQKAHDMGCECMQIFVGNPRQWKIVRRGKADRSAFRAHLESSGIRPLVAHAAYLVNLASPRSAMRRRSVSTVVAALKEIEDLDGEGVVTHIGSPLGESRGLGIERVALSVREILQRTERATLYLENSAGTTLGCDFSELQAILEQVEHHPRVQFCLDTAHLFGAGYDLRTAAGVRRMLQECERTIGLERARVWHLNDSKAALGSRLDRHENIGEGSIGSAGFRTLLRTRALADAAGILEVPGFAGEGPDRENLEVLRALAGSSGRSGASGNSGNRGSVRKSAPSPA